MTQLPLAVSMGDPAGIGPDILLKAWHNRNELDLPDMIAVGHCEFLERRAFSIGAAVQIAKISNPTEFQTGKLCVVDVGGDVTGIPGKATLADARATIAAIETGVDLVLQNACAALVTCPINKDALYQAGFQHPGHTEFLGYLAQDRTGSDCKPVMMLAGPDLRTVPVTIHIPLSEVTECLNKQLIVDTVAITYRDLKERFGLEAPRIAVAGLNPHAGEGGALGKEEVDIIIPALRELADKGIVVTGPLPADTMFHAAARKKYDAAVCMYHDQALIPAKMIGFDDAVNVTLGLPFIRTSPDHGTAYDIAGTGKASTSSFVAALAMAGHMAAPR